jgi:hypothetical protein
MYSYYSDLGRFKALRELQKNRPKKSHFILYNWIIDSIKDGHYKNERLYEPKINY